MCMQKHENDWAWEDTFTEDLNPSGMSQLILGGGEHTCVMDCALSHAQKTSQLSLNI